MIAGNRGPAATVTVTAGELELLLHQLSIDAVPVVLSATSRCDSATERDAVFTAARGSLSARGLLVDGAPHPDVADLLTVLARPIVELALRRYRRDGEVSRMCAVGNGSGAVLAVRGPDSYAFTPVESVDPEVVLTVLGRATALDCGSLRAPTASLAAALGDCTDPAAVAGRLSSLGCAEVDAVLLAHGFGERTSHAEIVAIAHLDGGRQRIGGPVTVFDTGRGRIVGTSTTAADGVAWSTLGPGHDARIRQAVRDLLASAVTDRSVQLT